MLKRNCALWIVAAFSFNALVMNQACADHTTEHSIAQRLEPVGQVKVASTPASAAQTAAKPLGPDAGKLRYDTSCVACHTSGAAGAPKLGDKAAWKPRIAKGLDTLVKNALKGLNAMPPKGTCMTCSDDEIRKTVEYMVDKSK